MTVLRLFLRQLLTLMALVSIATGPEFATGQRQLLYHQAPIPIGAGGYVTGLAIHPSEPFVKYCRTDVGGAYRWCEADGKWIQLFTTRNFDDTNGSDDVGVESIAVATSNSSRVYVAAFGAIYSSTNSGESFTKISPNFELQPNNPSEWRVHGERLAIDPMDENRVVFGSRNDGLWTTQDGSNWVKAALPDGLPNVGVTCCVFAPAESTPSGQNVASLYVAISNQGILKSLDGGVSFEFITGGEFEPLNELMEVTDMEVAKDGTLMVTIGPPGEFGDSDQTGFVWKYRPDAAWGPSGSDWQNITPPDPWHGDFISVALDPNNSNRAVVSEPGFKIAHYTIDGGANWIELTDGWESDAPIRVSPEIPWHETSGAAWFEHGEIQFDPNFEDRLICAHGMGIWYSDNVDAQVNTRAKLGWTTQSRGIEELVARDIVAPPRRAPIMGAMDFTSFRITSYRNYLNERSRDGRLSDTWDLAYQENDPDFIVMSAYKFGENQSSYSTDAGRTWQEFPSLANGNHPENLNWGVMAVSTTSNSVDRTIVWSPSDNTLPYYSEDGGNSWIPVESWPEGSDGNPIATGIWFQFFRAQTLIADPNVAGRFYMYLKAEDGVLVKSDDGGKNWTLVSDQLPMWGHHGVLRAVPGRTDHLWFTPGIGSEDQGVWHSTDAGVTFDKLPSFTKATSVSIGKENYFTSEPTVFVLGEFEGQPGVYLSNDYGNSWAAAVTGAPLNLLDTATNLEADRTRYGRFFIGYQGTGFSWGRPRGFVRSFTDSLNAYARLFELLK